MKIYLPILTVDFNDGQGPVERIGFTLRYEFDSEAEALNYHGERWATYMEAYHRENADLVSVRVAKFKSSKKNLGYV